MISICMRTYYLMISFKKWRIATVFEYYIEKEKNRIIAGKKKTVYRLKTLAVNQKNFK